MIPIIDLHLHPSLKVYMFNKDIRQVHHPWSDIYPFGMHVDLPGMQQADVRVIWCSHYIPEAGFGKLEKSEWLFKLLRFFLRRIFAKWEIDGNKDDAFNKTLQSIDKINRQLISGSKEFNVVNPINLVEFNEAFRLGKMIVLHTVEGAHQLGSNSNNPQHYVANLEALKKKGVCSLTLAHFFENEICGTGGGIPPSMAEKIGYPISPCLQQKGLTPIGKVVVHWCLDNGIIIDLNHSNIATRKEVYGILEQRKCEGKTNIPISFTHTGVREIAGEHMCNRCDLEYLPDLEEIKLISCYNGIIGLILMNYWLIGVEEDDPTKIDTATPHIIRSIERIHEYLGNYDSIAIGTDLDGFTQVPDDFRHVRLLNHLSAAVEKKFGIEIANKICYQNALRVLSSGWT